MTPTVLHQWAIRHGVSMAALQELSALAGADLAAEPLTAEPAGPTEAWTQSAVRLEASHTRLNGRPPARLFRNNVGALKDERGVPVRYGLANDSPRLNAKLKSHDLIGWRSVLITPAMVGLVIAQFLSRECKRPGWTWTGTDREVAQMAWATLVNSEGGDARFTTGPGTL
jgi:hypothetical protein